MAPSMTIAEIAEHLGGDVEGDATARVTGMASLQEAVTGEVTFVAHAKYAADAASTKATAALVSRDWKRPCPAVLVRVDDPDLAFTELTALFAPPAVQPEPGVHATAVVAEGAVLGEGVCVGPHVVIEAGVRIGDRTQVSAGCYIGHDVTVGSDSKLYPNVSVRERVSMGDRVIIHDGTVIGSDGFGYRVVEGGARVKVPQIGTVEIGDDVEIGANVTVDRARFGKTKIGSGVKIDNLVQIAHNVVIGDHAVIVAQVGIAGSSEIGPHAILAGQVGVAGHIRIGEGAVAGAQSGVWKDIPPKTQVFGYPALPQKQAMSLQRLYMKLPLLRDRLADLESRLKELEDRAST
jgi:UDP-3-O-[3-hydroxymyristoyl] glucosamine N-acyltransferase